MSWSGFEQEEETRYSSTFPSRTRMAGRFFHETLVKQFVNSEISAKFCLMLLTTYAKILK